MPDLNRSQFSQPTLPGLPQPLGHDHVGAGEAVPQQARKAHIEDYHATFGPDSPAHGTAPTGSVKRNPLYSQRETAASLKWDRFNVQQRQQQGSSYPYEPSAREEYVPMEKVSSFQKVINPAAVEHIAANANMLDLNESPIMSKHTNLDTGEDRYMVEDGNHRTNAAQRQGRLFIPAQVNAWRRR